MVENKELEKVLDYNELMRLQFQTDYIVSELIEKGTITMLFATPSSGKSFVIDEIALAVCRGDKLWGHFGTKPINVLMLDNENGHYEQQRRLKLLTQLTPEQGQHLFYYGSSGMKFETSDMHGAEGKLKTDWAIQIIKEKDIGLMTLDAYIDFTSSDENSSQTSNEFFKNIRHIRDETDVALLITHHTTKANKELYRGSSDIEGKVDNLFRIVKDDNESTEDKHTINFYADKFRRGKKPNGFILTRSFGENVETVYGGSLKEARAKQEMANSYALEYVEKLKEQGAVELLTGDASEFGQELVRMGFKYQVSGAIDNLEDEGKIEKVKKGKYKIL